MASSFGLNASTDTAAATLVARQWTAQASCGEVTVPALRDIVIGQCQAAFPYSRADGGFKPVGPQPAGLIDAVAYHMPGVETLSRLKLVGDYDREMQRSASRLTTSVLAHLRNDAPATARHILETSQTTEHLDTQDLAALQVRIAAVLLYDGENEQAGREAEASLAAASSLEAAWFAGLASYSQHDFAKARVHFATMYDAADGETWSSSAAAFWAARAATNLGDKPGAAKWFARAAETKTSFYGMMAARALNANNPTDFDPAAWPIPRWKPQNGFTVDPALIYAIARQESRFDPKAESDSGAIGLMQLMPDTAKAVTAKTDGTSKNGVEEALYNPETNLELGQRYVHELLGHADIGGNLITMAVAYNGGPGNLARWSKSANADSDPLLFLETLPAGETRGFIEQVLTNYWIYRIRLNESTESLSDLSAGKWPRYKAPDVKAKAPPMLMAALQPAFFTPASNSPLSSISVKVRTETW